MTGGGHHVDQVADLPVGAVQRGIDHQGDVDRLEPLLQAPDHRDRRVGFLGDAEDDLKAGVVLPAQRGQGCLQQRFVAVQGLQHCHGGPDVGVGPGFAREARHQPRCRGSLGDADAGQERGEAGQERDHQMIGVMSRFGIMAGS